MNAHTMLILSSAHPDPAWRLGTLLAGLLIVIRAETRKARPGSAEPGRAG